MLLSKYSIKVEDKLKDKMKFTYMKAPLNKYTFKSKRIKTWVQDTCEGRVLNLFAGKIELNCDEVRNDIDDTMNAEYHKDALMFVKSWNGGKFDTILLDPPYSYRKSMELYNAHIMSPFNALKDRLLKILKPGGIVITFGYHSISLGKKRGFVQEHILLISHGGAIHDTIATVERWKEGLK